MAAIITEPGVLAAAALFPSLAQLLVARGALRPWLLRAGPQLPVAAVEVLLVAPPAAWPEVLRCASR